jgi:carbamoyl-phosphate synthase large subunit
MGTADTFGKAYDKAQAATNKPIPRSGTAVVDVSAAEFPDKESDAAADLRDGFAEFFDLRSFDDDDAFIEAIMNDEIDLIVSRNRDALEVAVEEDVTYFSTHASARATLEALRAADEDPSVIAVSDRPRRKQDWGT